MISGVEVLAIENMAKLEHYSDLEILMTASIDDRTDTLTLEISTATEDWRTGEYVDVDAKPSAAQSSTALSRLIHDSRCGVQ
jgi:hypothetical protein